MCREQALTVRGGRVVCSKLPSELRHRNRRRAVPGSGAVVMVTLLIDSQCP